MSGALIFKLITFASALTLLGACSSEPEVPVATHPAASSGLATPVVTMAADPPPPFTYWAPEGSTIRNHPNDQGAWIAERADGTRKFYFGDQCRASERQGWVGQSVDTLPQTPSGQKWRTACTTCAVTSDLQRDRLNISYDETTRRVVEVSCG